MKLQNRIKTTAIKQGWGFIEKTSDSDIDNNSNSQKN